MLLIYWTTNIPEGGVNIFPSLFKDQLPAGITDLSSSLLDDLHLRRWSQPSLHSSMTGILLTFSEATSTNI